MISKVIDAVERYGMLNCNTMVVGVSGGADSVALLHILCELQPEYGYELTVAHVNHCLRAEESERDERFVTELCRKKGVRLCVKRTNVALMAADEHLGLEECGRRVRYEFFSSLDCDRIATAHTLSDSAETLLLNLARGTSLSGLCSIPPVRGNVVRPLIFCTSDEVRAYCRDNGIEYVNDSSNLSDDYARNRIRHSVIPVLRSVNSCFEGNVGRCLDSLRDDERLLSEMADTLLNEAEVRNGYDAEMLLCASRSVLFRALKKLLYRESGIMPERKHLDALCTMLSCGGSVTLCGATDCSVKNGVLCFPHRAELSAAWCIEAVEGVNTTPCGCVSLKQITRKVFGQLRSQEKGNCFDADKAGDELRLRSRLAGDSYTDGRRRLTKPLKKLFQEMGIPSDERGGFAILGNDKGLVWLSRVGVSAQYGVTDESKRIVIVSMSVKNEGKSENA